MIIQLNLAALERLLGGDSEVEVALRHQVVNEFALKHLKPLVNDPVMVKIVTEMRREIEEYIGKEIWDTSTGRYRTELRERVKKLIEGALQEILAGLVQRSFDAVVKAYEEKIDERINRYEMRLLGKANDVLAARLTEVGKLIDGALAETVKPLIAEQVRLILLRGLAEAPNPSK